MRTDPPFIGDTSIVALLGDDPELLALADAITATQTASIADAPRSGSPPRSRRRRPFVVAAIVIALALLATAAYAVVRYVIVGSPAPEQVQVSEKVLDQAKDTLAGLSFTGYVGRIEVAKTRAGAVLSTSSGPVYLWVAPTTTGRRCAYLQITGLQDRFTGGSPFLMALRPMCVGPARTASQIINAFPFLDIVNTGVNGHTLSVVAGSVPPPARTVQLRYSNGRTSAKARVVDGWVLVEGSRYDPRPQVIIRDAHGRRIEAGGTQLLPLRVLNSPSGPSRYTLKLALDDHQGTVVMTVGPAADGGSCELLRLPGGAGAVSSCGPRRAAPDAIDVSRAGFSLPGSGGVFVHLLRGRVGTAIKTLAIRDADGTEHSIPIHHHWVLFQLVPGRSRAVELIGRDSHGRIVAVSRPGLG